MSVGEAYVTEVRDTGSDYVVPLDYNGLGYNNGALLRMNRSIQAEGTFGIMKNDRWYKRIVRRGIDSVRMELFLVSIGHNLYKYHKKQMRLQKAA